MVTLKAFAHEELAVPLSKNTQDKFDILGVFRYKSPPQNRANLRENNKS